MVFFSGCTQEQLIAQAVALGADAYVLKTQSLQTLHEAMEKVRRGGRYFDPALIQMNTRMAVLPGSQILTARERQVVRLVAEGKSVSVTRYAIVAGLTSLD